MNPRWRQLQESWLALSNVHCSTGMTGSEDARTERQAALLRLLLGRGPGRTDAKLSVEKIHPVALELMFIMNELGHEAQGPTMEGPIELHAVSGCRAFCLLSEDMFFRRERDAVAFEEPAISNTADLHSIDSGFAASRKFELCLERHFELQLLQSRGWQVTSIPFFLWRQLSKSDCQSLVAEAFEVPQGTRSDSAG